ncbi:SET domain-containing protein [Sphaerospermopsis kisseleviana CS-549]|uniref:Nuclear protein SET n=2 Tax=Sphaerospermopsis TaxID=752201 RepID=A0A479ZZ98_9CYAN|nr:MULTISPECIES: SET domain-containing protein [Sphaerospermopsis]BAZ80894.1 nuclear protein SET [Sphaerospermopsis kisseleviana NIES-73]MBD2132137.1 SET domain-containing protein-lysine N-methyltransferase [Sphaerospermopsis sp. FACHB-1094]MBD2144585.1 SET domain-containing protein-lysine N-methyltransferase [Sphaerospermopsis sp. FACHB-1194]MDB9439936.1 SET domain-containing protein [Sphaerospermopsis kisseleviana CS-549]GCL38005.1 nuclear protein SET [Sphaerospermopsis reniformis]
MLVVRDTEIKGRGVFAQRDFELGEIIDIANVIVIPKQQVKLITHTVLCNYYFGWHGESGAIALGYGSLFNHSYQPNALYVKKFDQQIIEIIAYKYIREGQEITINYNGNVDDLTPIWFDVVD